MCIPEQLALQNLTNQLLTQKDTKNIILAEPLSNCVYYPTNEIESLDSRSLLVPCLNCQMLGGSWCHFRESWRKEPQDNKWSQQLLGSCPNISWSGPASYKQQGSWLAKPNCSWVQAHSTHCKIGQWIREMRCWGREGTLIGEPADQEDGSLAPQINHLIRVWMPGCFIDQRERSNEELKSKGRRRGRCSGEVNWEGLQSCKTFPRGWKAFWKGVLISSIYRWARTNYLSLSWTKALQFTVKQGDRDLQASQWVQL